VHEAKLRFDHNIVPSSVRVWARLAVSRDGSVDETGVDLAEGLIVHGVLLQSSRKVVFHEDITLGCQLVQNLNTLFMLE
jgi:hypothetical protein